jgi:hypothetical protein
MHFIFVLILIVQIGLPALARGQDSHTAKLIEGAKKEGALVWYTSTSVEDITRLFAGFNKRYPFIKTEYSTRVRHGSTTAFSMRAELARFSSI